MSAISFACFSPRLDVPGDPLGCCIQIKSISFWCTHRTGRKEEEGPMRCSLLDFSPRPRRLGVRTRASAVSCKAVWAGGNRRRAEPTSERDTALGLLFKAEQQQGRDVRPHQWTASNHHPTHSISHVSQPRRSNRQQLTAAIDSFFKNPADGRPA